MSKNKIRMYFNYFSKRTHRFLLHSSFFISRFTKKFKSCNICWENHTTDNHYWDFSLNASFPRESTFPFTRSRGQNMCHCVLDYRSKNTADCELPVPNCRKIPADGSARGQLQQRRIYGLQRILLFLVRR